MAIEATMRAVRLHPPGDVAHLRLDEVEVPSPGPGEALVRVHAAGLTRGELEWPVDRLPAVPSYEFSGVVASVAPDVSSAAAGEAVYALAGFDRDGAAADYALVPAAVLAPKPLTLGHTESAALPLAGLSAWQGLFDHGRLERGERVLIVGGAGGVGHLATQLARWRGAFVAATASGPRVEQARALGADVVIDRGQSGHERGIAPVDLVFDTVGGEALARFGGLVREGGRVVSVAEEPPATLGLHVKASYFVVEPNRDELVELARLADEGVLRPAIDSVFQLADARDA